MGARRTKAEAPPVSEDGCPQPPVKQKASVEKHTVYNKKVETNSIPFCYEYKDSCKYVQSFELFL